jgi:hypothetical protein
MKKPYKIILLVICLLACLLFAAFAFLPWQLAVQNKLQNILIEKGFDNVVMTLSDVGLHEARLSNITFGNDKNLTLEDLTLHYSLPNVWSGNLHMITVTGLGISLKQVDDKWTLQGYRSSKPNTSFLFPMTASAVSKIPIQNLMITKSQLNILADTWHMNIPFQAKWAKDPIADISLESTDAQFISPAGTIKIAGTEAHAVFDAKDSAWIGDWKTQDIKAEAYLPKIQGKGLFKINGNESVLSGSLQSVDNIYALQFNVTIPASSDVQSILTVEQASMTWKGGTVVARDVKIPLKGTKPIRFVVQVEKLSVDDLMQTMTGKRISATGLVSGNLPITLKRDGSFSFNQGKLQSIGQGIITIPEDMMPGDNPQIQLTRDILKNFHYRNLSIAIKNNNAQGINLLLALEGNNPDVYGGRPVKLNVNLSGDVLDFVKKNAKLIQDPNSLLQPDKK